MNEDLDAARGIINAIVITFGSAAFVVALWFLVCAVFSLGS